MHASDDLTARAVHPAVNIRRVLFSLSIRRNFSRNKTATRKGNGNGKSFDPELLHRSYLTSLVVSPLNYFRWVQRTINRMTHIYRKSEILFLYLTYSRWRCVFDIFVCETLIYCFHIDGFHKIRFNNFVHPLNIRGRQKINIRSKEQKYWCKLFFPRGYK